MRAVLASIVALAPRLRWIAASLVGLAIASTSAEARAHGDLAIPTETPTHPGDDEGPAPELDVEEGVAAPAGYHLARRPRTPAILGGALLFVPAYGIALSRALGGDCEGCDSGRQRRLLAPIVGPFLFGFGCDTCSRGLWIVDGALQIAGAALVVYGLFTRPVWVLDATAEVRVAPLVGAGNPGLSVIGTF